MLPGLICHWSCIPPLGTVIYFCWSRYVCTLIFICLLPTNPSVFLLALYPCPSTMTPQSCMCQSYIIFLNVCKYIPTPLSTLWLSNLIILSPNCSLNMSICCLFGSRTGYLHRYAHIQLSHSIHWQLTIVCYQLSRPSCQQGKSPLAFLHSSLTRSLLVIASCFPFVMWMAH